MWRKRKKITLKNIVNWEPFVYVLRKEWDETAEKPEENIILRDRIWEGIHKNIRQKQSWKSRYYFLKITSVTAASVLVCFFAVKGLLSEGIEEMPPPNILLVSAEESKTYILPDGTKVWMEAGSELRFPDNFTENRELWLTGNSTFEVVKQHENCFKVYLSNAHIEVKGTSFFINQDIPETNVIALYSGRINFIPGNDRQMIELYPSQRIIYNSIEALTHIEPIYENIYWQDGNYKLSRTDLTDLAGFLTWKYNINIELENLPQGTLIATGNIRYDESLESVLNKVTYSLKLKYRQIDGKYIIYR